MPCSNDTMHFIHFSVVNTLMLRNVVSIEIFKRKKKQKRSAHGCYVSTICIFQPPSAHNNGMTRLFFHLRIIIIGYINDHTKRVEPCDTIFLSRAHKHTHIYMYILCLNCSHFQPQIGSYQVNEQLIQIDFKRFDDDCNIRWY